MTREPTHVAFGGAVQLALGTLPEVAVAIKELLERDSSSAILVFSTETGEQIDLDLRGTLEEVRQRHLPVEDQPDSTERPGPGRPKLGVVAREVTLLPRHWEWLNQQPGGASVALRKLVEEGRRADAAPQAVRRAKEATYRFISVMAGNLPGFEEATRALYAGDRERFAEQSSTWPRDIQTHADRMAASIWG